jgi:asparagine synthetase B (glutamine-hydrolysing)
MCGILLIVRLLSSVNGWETLLPPIAENTILGDENPSTATNDAFQDGICPDLAILNSVLQEMSRRLSRRGPDCHSSLRFDYTSESSSELDVSVPITSEEATLLEIHGYLLAMRGNLPQPLVSRNSSGVVDRFIVWNGESFRAPFIKSMECLSVENESHSDEESDTKLVFELLRDSEPLSALEQVEGPWATVYYSKKDQSIYFGRDPRGRRSLMIGNVANKFLVISSIPWVQQGLPIDWIEVDTKGIYKLHLPSTTISLQAWKPEISQIAHRAVVVSSDGTKKPDEVIIQELTDVLRMSIRRRVHFRGDHTHFIIRPTSSSETASGQDVVDYEQPAPVAVLFSGGLDSTVLAALVNLELPEKVPIDLINVAFGTESQSSAAPDRITCLQSYEDLRLAAPTRPWRLVLVNIPKSELEQFTPEIAALMYPNNTLMDISISAPLWFASRGMGVTTEVIGAPFLGSRLVPYTSRAKVLLLGAGADEQFAGYGRHRVSYRKGGWQGLQDELDKDIKRLWKRNLGRDDRVLSDHGKESRFPFLDADVMQWISSQYLTDLCDMTLEPGEGDKRSLRLVATSLSLTTASKLPKRAIQFGTKITKQMPKGKGTDNFEA